MRLTKEWFKKHNACIDGYKWVLQRKSDDASETMEALIRHNLEWANWTIARKLTRKQKIRYAIFAAEEVLELFEKKHPNNKAPREAIAAAKAVLKSDNKKTRADADAAANAAYAAYAAAAYAHADAYAAYAYAAAANAAYAYEAATKEKIIRYGMGLVGI